MMRSCAIVLMTLLAMGVANAADAIPVVATFSVIGDMLANVGGDRLDIKTIVGVGGDCELYRPTAADVATVAAASAIFINDLNEDFEPWIEPLLKQAAFKGNKVVVSRGVHTLTAEEEHPVSGRQLPEAIDQHAWLDPRNGAIYVRNIAEALAHIDPDGAAGYRSRATTYAQQIRAVDDWARKEIAAVPAGKRRALASHDSLQYIARSCHVNGRGPRVGPGESGFKLPRRHSAIAPPLRLGRSAASIGRSGGVADRSCCRPRHGC